MKFSDLQTLDFQNAGNWPMPVKALAIALVFVAVLGAGYWFDTSDQWDVLQAEHSKEDGIKQTFEIKQAKAANLEAYKQQLVEMEQSFGTYAFTAPGKRGAGRLFVETFTEFQTGTHGECTAGCCEGDEVCDHE